MVEKRIANKQILAFIVICAKVTNRLQCSRKNCKYDTLSGALFAIIYVAAALLYMLILLLKETIAELQHCKARSKTAFTKSRRALLVQS